jgi:uncharacterized protein YukE
MFFSAVIRLARAILQNVLSQLMQQFNQVTDEVLSPMRAIVSQVTGGVWIGQGADAFVEEVSSIMIPGAGQVGESITSFHGNLTNAMDVMDQADSAVSNIVNGISDIFGSIF